MKACRLSDDEDFDDDDVRHRKDPIILEMNFSLVELSNGMALKMEGRAYPYASSGSWFGYGSLLRGTVEEDINKVIASEKRWFKESYPSRRIILKVSRPGKQQSLTDLSLKQMNLGARV